MTNILKNIELGTKINTFFELKHAILNYLTVLFQAERHAGNVIVVNSPYNI